jgi:hypothetical protein
MKEMRILARVALLALACVIPAMAADDLPHFEGRFKTSVFSVEGDADYVLSGINLYRTTISETIARFGNPIRVRVAARKGKLAGGRDYEWKRGDVEIRVGTCYGHGVEELLCSVEVRGARDPSKKMASARAAGGSAPPWPKFGVSTFPRVGYSPRLARCLTMMKRWLP